MKIIGLTGSIGTGKSTVARMLKKKRVPVICADYLARQVVKRGQPTYKKIVASFGPTILRKDKQINRMRLGEVVFSHPAKRRQLEKIIHPAVIERIKNETIRLKKKGKKFVVWDVPLLFESGMDKLCDTVVVVYTTCYTQIERIQMRDNFTETEIFQRLKSQMPMEKKKKMADYVINNDGSLAATKKQVNHFIKIFQNSSHF